MVGSTWVLRNKNHADGTHNKVKGRACVQGFSQQYGIDYQDTYAPTLPMLILRLVLAITVHHGMQLSSMDALPAFLNSVIDKPVYVEQFQGFVDSVHPDWVYFLLKGLYGLKQSPLLWFDLCSSTPVSYTHLTLPTN